MLRPVDGKRARFDGCFSEEGDSILILGAFASEAAGQLTSFSR